MKSDQRQTCRRGKGVRHREPVYRPDTHRAIAGGSQDVLTEILRKVARETLSKTVGAAVAAWIDDHAHLKDDAGRRQVVRHGSHPKRIILRAVLDRISTHPTRWIDQLPSGRWHALRPNRRDGRELSTLRGLAPRGPGRVREFRRATQPVIPGTGKARRLPHAYQRAKMWFAEALS